ncbi:CPBP family intramembrane metalloprotease [Saccharopolyspora indica]|uniref:CPBP family intramembrane glutamic endopeptidase n=1 Tax=Saccharopolyspora indica TaxID=1229659 RepID=UPI0022EAE79C|nr:CPBP family intramembrane glutamic endopeptidase [Saccharopolyspora indica]MDA3647379.1 CPBP family intramembrane metalloprotease [Saccharopolyspora indica]
MRTKIAARPVLAFTALAWAGMWIAMMPLLISGFQRTSSDIDLSVLELVCISAAMLTPALAAFVVLRRWERGTPIRATLGLAWNRRTALDCLVALVCPLALTLLALAIGTAAGAYHPDLTDFSGFRRQFAPETTGERGVPLPALAVWAGSLLIQMLVSLPLFFGEELGWQGYLFPRLRPRGPVFAVLVTGVVFALWHLPTLLMGGQYPDTPWPVAIGAFLISCVLVVPIFAWLRTRSASVLPAVVAHTVVSTAAVHLPWVLADAGNPPHPLTTGLTAWPGWLAMALLLAVLVIVRRRSNRGLG